MRSACWVCIRKSRSEEAAKERTRTMLLSPPVMDGSLKRASLTALRRRRSIIRSLTHLHALDSCLLHLFWSGVGWSQKAHSSAC